MAPPQKPPAAHSWKRNRSSSGRKTTTTRRTAPPPHATSAAGPGNTTASSSRVLSMEDASQKSSARHPSRRDESDTAPRRHEAPLQDDSLASSSVAATTPGDSPSKSSTGGFSPNSLVDRYSAEIDHTARIQEKKEAKPAIETSLSTTSSVFWGKGGSPPPPEEPETDERPTDAATTAVTSDAKSKKIQRLDSSSERFDFDVDDHYGAPAQARRHNVPPKGGAFGQKERFEHVDQSVNLMAMARGDEDELSYSRTSGITSAGQASSSARERHQGKETRTGIFGRVGRTRTKRQTSHGILRTLSTEFTDIALGRRDSAKTSRTDLHKDSIIDEGEEEHEQISKWECCQCLCFSSLLVVIVLFLTHVIPTPEKWTDDAPAFELPSFPGTTAEKSGEGPPPRWHSPAPSPFPSHHSNRWDEIESMVIGAHLSRAEELVDADSIQHKALVWLSDSDSTSLGQEAVLERDNDEGMEEILLERYALAVFFFAMHEDTMSKAEAKAYSTTGRRPAANILGDESLKAAFENRPDKKLRRSSNLDELQWLSSDWHLRDGWLTPIPVCEWYGIQCHRSGRVSALRLSHNNMLGSLPRELWALSELQHLDLSHNTLQKQVPSILWKSVGWPELVTLDLSHNMLTGQLPEEITGFGLLENMTLSENHLTGELPKSISMLSNLKVLDLQGNQFGGSLRDTSPIPTLRILKLSNNQFENGFPFSLTQNRNLTELSLHHNLLGGTLPPELDSLSQLKILSLDSNQFEGPLPDIFERLENLEVLELQNNRFGKHHDEDESARMPASIGMLSNLKTLKLNTNKIHSGVPEEWWNMTSLEVLHLFDNDFSGTIPTAIGEFSHLRDFQVQDTFLSGSLPTHLGKCDRLESLRVYNCLFTGEMPEQICSLHSSEDEQATAPAKRLQLLAADCKSAIKCACCDRCY